MSKYQTDREIFYGICKFFSSKAWWRPIIEFIYSNSRSFQNSFEYSTEDEHNVYIKFMDMVTDLVDNYMCSKLHISSDAFENFMSQFLTEPNDKAIVIFDTLKHATNYNEFCKQMHLCNIRIENSITRALLKFSEDESINSTDELAVFVAKQIEKDQNNEIDDLVHKACVQTKKLMGISVLNSSPKRLDPKPSSIEAKSKISSTQLSKVFSTPTKSAPIESESSLIDSKNENDKCDENKNQIEQNEPVSKIEKEKHKKHKHSHKSRHSHSKLNKTVELNESNENDSSVDKKNRKSKHSKKVPQPEKYAESNENKQVVQIVSNENKNDQKVKIINVENISNENYDNESSDISELSDEEESEDDLMSTLKRHRSQIKNNSTLNGTFLRPPLMPINRLNNPQKKTCVSIVIDSP